MELKHAACSVVCIFSGVLIWLFFREFRAEEIQAGRLRELTVHRNFSVERARQAPEGWGAGVTILRHGARPCKIPSFGLRLWQLWEKVL